jgi:hypothetical protein
VAEALIDLGFATAKVEPIWENRDNQEKVTDEEILRTYKDEKAQQNWFETLLRSYRASLLEEDLATILDAQDRWFFPMGRIEPHFSASGDGWMLLDDLRRDIQTVTSIAGDDVVKRIRYSYAMYRYHATGEKGRREFMTLAVIGSLTSRLAVAKMVQAAKGNGLGTSPPVPPPVTRWVGVPARITRWTVTPEGMAPLQPGRIRVFTGQSSDTILSFLELGIELRPPTHPGRAQAGAGVYTSPQKPIAESYAEQHPAGLTVPLEPDVTGLNVLDVSSQAGRQAFSRYLDSVPGLRAAWDLAEENRYPIVEAFISRQVGPIDLYVAPHGEGLEMVFRSEVALQRLTAAMRRQAAGGQ